LDNQSDSKAYETKALAKNSVSVYDAPTQSVSPNEN